MKSAEARICCRTLPLLERSRDAFSGRDYSALTRFAAKNPHFRDESDLNFIDAGGEATVFFEPDKQQIIKLFAPPGEGRFGWVLDRRPDGSWHTRGGSMIEALWRFAWFEACFASGLELDSLGLDADFLNLSQPFFVGRRSCEDELEE